MSNWKEKALETFKIFPDIVEELEDTSDPAELWSDLEWRLTKAIENDDQAYFHKVKLYFYWCLSLEKMDPAHQAALCGLLEDIGIHKRHWPFLNILLDKQQFERYKSVVTYMLSTKEAKLLENTFYERLKGI